VIFDALFLLRFADDEQTGKIPKKKEDRLKVKP
jgi:hypothetical protein